MKIQGLIVLAVLCASVSQVAGCGSGTSGGTVAPPPVVAPDVYVAGWELNAAGVKVAMVWKNGIGTALSDGVHGAYAAAVAVSGNDVYVAGLVNNGSWDVATVWLNGVTTALTDGQEEAEVSAIAIAGTHVIVTGSEFGALNGGYGATFEIAGYWEDGVFTQLASMNSAGVGAGEMTGIYIYDSDIYVSGEQTVLFKSASLVAPLTFPEVSTEVLKSKG